MPLFLLHFIKIVFYIYYFILMSGVEPCLSPIFAFHADRKCRLAELSNKYFSVKMSVFFYCV